MACLSASTIGSVGIVSVHLRALAIISMPPNAIIIMKTSFANVK